MALFFFCKLFETNQENKGTGRISSKLVGDEISKSNSGIKDKDRAGLNCSAHDSDKVWPLFCYDLTVSLDQEERLLQTFKR